ncbi:MAG: hypothetical protein FJW37_00340 [Acidobacteria bacterium]|nr:hypothetical protein [Acidobacteriota bacterium]
MTTAAVSGPARAQAPRDVLSYSGSFVTFVTKGRGNLARLQIESRCLLLDQDGRTIEEFFQFASCKSEHTYAQENLFQDPNYDFSGVFSREHYVLFRARAPQDPATYAERGVVKERFDKALFEIRRARNAKLLATGPDKVRATLGGLALVGRSEIRDPATGRSAILEYPIKTMNVQDERMIYQVDTGPLAFPDFGSKATRPIDSIELAYVAFNTAEEAYFVLQRVTPVTGGARVCHYSDIRRMPARNTVLSVSL